MAKQVITSLTLSSIMVSIDVAPDPSPEALALSDITPRVPDPSGSIFTCEAALSSNGPEMPPHDLSVAQADDDYPPTDSRLIKRKIEPSPDEFAGPPTKKMEISHNDAASDEKWGICLDKAEATYQGLQVAINNLIKTVGLPYVHRILWCEQQKLEEYPTEEQTRTATDGYLNDDKEAAAEEIIDLVFANYKEAREQYERRLQEAREQDKRCGQA